MEQDASNKEACAVKITTKTQSQDVLRRGYALGTRRPNTEPRIMLFQVITPDGHELERTVDIPMTPFPGMLFSSLLVRLFIFRAFEKGSI